MNKHISIIAGFCTAAFALTACSDDFLEVTKPDGEPLEEYYHLRDLLQSRYLRYYLMLAGTIEIAGTEFTEL